MNRKYFLFILQFLTSICIVSVGFASWTIVSGVSIEESGTISAEDVHTNESYLQNPTIVPFRYYDTGFVSGSGTTAQIVNTAQLIYTYDLNITNLKNDLGLGENGSSPLKIQFTLSHTDIDEFSFINDYCLEKQIAIILSNNDSDNSVTSVNLVNANDIPVADNIATVTLVGNIIVKNDVSMIHFTSNNEIYATAYDYFQLQIVYSFSYPSYEEDASFSFKTSIFPYISSSDFYFYHKLDISYDE